MGFTVGKKEDEISAEPNVVPLCDVLLVLLIIFMVVTPLIQKGVDVKLPSALNTIEMPENPEIVIHIKEDETIYVNSDKTTLEDLPSVLEETLLTADEKKIYLRADSDLEYGVVVEIADILKDAGIEVLGMILEKRTGKAD
jgi:biopolymer transport protein TolR